MAKLPTDGKRAYFGVGGKNYFKTDTFKKWMEEDPNIAVVSYDDVRNKMMAPYIDNSEISN